MACWINFAILATAHVCEFKCTTINVYDSSFKFSSENIIHYLLSRFILITLLTPIILLNICFNPLKAERHSNLWKSDKLIPSVHILCTSSHRIEDSCTKTKVSESRRRFLQSFFASNFFTKHKQLKYCVQLMIMTKHNI